MPNEPTARSIDEYIARLPSDTQAMLREVRSLVREVAPTATETISYAIPTFDLNGRHLVHFAGYKRHIAIYPVPHGEGTFKEELARYQTGKGTAQFALDQPLPKDLIRDVVASLVAENIRKTSKQG